MNTRPKLTEALEHRIVMWIRSGAHAHVAAEAEGVPYEVFDRWLERGTRKSPRPPAHYRRFAHSVRTAVAVSRIRAEIEVAKEDPRCWLLSGPGKERPDYAGWSSAGKAMPRPDRGEVNLFADPALAGVLEAVLKALAPFPEARRAVADALAAPEPPPPPLTIFPGDPSEQADEQPPEIDATDQPD
jgi:hypothetical protein